MSYLLWQIFWCLLGTALLFLALGWLLRGWFKSRANDKLITDSEKSRWQTSFDGLKSRLEAETGRRLAAEKALEDSRTQQAKISSLLDQHTTEIKTLSQELTVKGQSLSQRDASLKQLQTRIAELELQQSSSQDMGGSERDGLLAQLQTISAENSTLREEAAATTTKLASAVAAGAEVATLRARVADLEPKLAATDAELGKLKLYVSEMEPKLTAFALENGKLKSQVSELTPKLAMAAAAGAEVIALKAQVAQLEPQVSKFQTSDTELSTLRGQLADLQQRLQAFAVENQNLKDQLVERDTQIPAMGSEVSLLKSNSDDLESKLAQVQATDSELVEQIHVWEARYSTTVAQKDAELSQCRSRVAELEQHGRPQTMQQQASPKVERDDLKKIYGIGPVLEKRLNDLGVYFFREIAMWTKEDILRYEEHLKEFRDRIERDHWVEGASEAHFKKYGERLEKTNSASA
jgi:predicted flap endonuclease-1-like 5' DNA nuclease